MRRSIINQLAVILLVLELLYLASVLYQSNFHTKVALRYPRVSQYLGGPDSLSITVQKFLDNIKDSHPSRHGTGYVSPLVSSSHDISQDIMYIDKSETDLSVDLLQQYLTVEEEDLEKLKRLHLQVTRSIPAPPLKNMKEKGIVMTGGGKLFGQALIAIRYITEKYQGIPVELWMAREEYEPEYCDNIFPPLGVRCAIVEDFFGSELKGFDYMGYPLKGLALAGSEFKKIYFMDVDSFPIGSLDNVFKSEPFNTTGMISWPDYWLRVTSPEFYHITGLVDLSTVNKSKDIFEIPQTVPYRRSSETGQIFIDKEKHWDSLLLAAYYNLNGANHYYPLLSQSDKVAGFGDKETFISAAYALGHDAYQVNHWVKTMGYFPEPGNYHGSAMLQYDPISDFNEEDEEKTKVFAVHCNNMKFDPFFMYSDEEDKHWNKANLNKWRRRLLGDADSVIRDLGYDFELDLHKVTQRVLCEWVVNHPPIHGTKQDLKALCNRAEYHVHWLRANPKNRQN